MDATEKRRLAHGPTFKWMQLKSVGWAHGAIFKWMQPKSVGWAHGPTFKCMQLKSVGWAHGPTFKWDTTCGSWKAWDMSLLVTCQ